MDVTACNNPEHKSLITIISQQSTLIVQLFAKIQDLEKKIEVSQQATQKISEFQSPTAQASNFTTPPQDSYTSQPGYSSPAPSGYDTRRAQAQGRPCNYGASCTREECWYDHPNSRPVGTSRQSTSTQSQSQPTSSSTKRAKQECRHGINCTRVDCRFEHPPDWVPPSNAVEEPAPPPPPQQESTADATAADATAAEAPAEAPAAEAPTAEVDSWDTKPDLSSWGATSTNDWGTPVDNTWGTSTVVADNRWGAATDNTWNTSNDQPKPASNNSRSASASMSREGSVANSSTSRSQGRGRRGARGKGRRADSESIATESTPMSPASLAPTPISTHVEPIPAQTPLPPPAQPVDQTSTFNEPNNSDELSTPVLESGPSSSPEPEAPSTPKASWSDEPNADVVYFPDPPPDMSESLPSVPEDDVNPPADDGSLNLDQYAPSALYSSWGATGVSASDWGLDPAEYPDPTPPADNKLSGKKSKSKGKQKETFSTGTNGRGTPSSRSSNPAAQSGTSTPSANEPEPAPKPPTPEPPQGVPHDQIPDWLLGGDDDAHAMLGIPRAASPKPSTPSAPSRLAPTNPAPRPPLSKLAGENFPTLSGILPTPKPSQSKDETPPKPTFSPRPVGWKITRTSDSSSSGRGKGAKSKDSSSMC